MAKRGFILYNDYAPQFNSLSDEQCGRLIKGIFSYVISGEQPKLSSKAEMAFMFIKNALDENADKYAETCRKRSEAAKKSHENRTSAIAGKCMQLHANAANTDTNTETVTDTDTVTDTNTNTVTSPLSAGFAGDRTGQRWANAQKKEKTISQKLKNAGFDFEFDDIFEKP